MCFYFLSEKKLDGNLPSFQLSPDLYNEPVSHSTKSLIMPLFRCSQVLSNKVFERKIDYLFLISQGPINSFSLSVASGTSFCTTFSTLQNANSVNALTQNSMDQLQTNNYK